MCCMENRLWRNATARLSAGRRSFFLVVFWVSGNTRRMAKMTDEYCRDTTLVRVGLKRSQFQETSETMFLNLDYIYDSA